MKRLGLSLVATTFILIGTVAQGQTIPDEIDINLQQSNPALLSQGKDKKEVKGFQHAAHIETLSKGAQDKDICLTCHKEVQHHSEIEREDRKERQRAVVSAAGSIKKYMHGQCLACHRGMKKQKEATGPTSCKGCHS